MDSQELKYLLDYAKKHNMSICFSAASRDPWEGYGGQDIFVLDDFEVGIIALLTLITKLAGHGIMERLSTVLLSMSTLGL